MRVLVVHNRYSSRVPSGENLAVDDEVRWLRDAGIDVATFEVTNDEVVEAGRTARIRQAAESLWSPSAQRRMAAELDRTRPDLVHVHNLFPLLTASVPWMGTRRRLPVVWTVHNRRLACVIGTNFRDGEPCQLCRPGWRAPGIRHACYGGSPAASALVTGATTIFGRLARRRVTAVAVSRAIEQWLTETAGFPAERVHVKHNAVEPPGGGEPIAPAASRRTFLFAGYLTDYKGVPLLLEAWRRAESKLPADVELRVVGDGPLVDKVQEATRSDPRIRWVGHVDPAEVARHLRDARAVVVPSVWEEPFGRSAAEALAYGRPVVTTATGGLADVVDAESGWITGPDPDRLAEALVTAATSDAEVEQRAGAATRRYKELFSPEASVRELVEIYRSAIGG